jgi:hypothetical protein
MRLARRQFLEDTAASAAAALVGPAEMLLASPLPLGGPSWRCGR